MICPVIYITIFWDCRRRLLILTQRVLQDNRTSVPFKLLLQIVKRVIGTRVRKAYSNRLRIPAPAAKNRTPGQVIPGEEHTIVDF